MILPLNLAFSKHIVKISQGYTKNSYTENSEISPWKDLTPLEPFWFCFAFVLRILTVFLKKYLKFNYEGHRSS